MKFLFSFFLIFAIGLPVFANTKIVTQTTASASGTSTKILDARTTRNYLLFQNNGATNIYLKFDAIHSGTEGIVVIAGGVWEPIEVPRNSIWIKAASATPSYTILEGAAAQ